MLSMVSTIDESSLEEEDSSMKLGPLVDSEEDEEDG